MTIRLLTAILSSFLFVSCQKESVVAETPSEKLFTTYTIRQGQHYCDQTTLQPVVISSSQSFKVKFDSSAIYKTTDPSNQEDINKLWGFSEGNDHQQQSARIGWAYTRNALRLYGYTYADGIRYSKEIRTIPIGTVVECKIQLADKTYMLSSGESSVVLPRTNSGNDARGFQLYPYFGGDEVAPQLIHINILPL